MDEKEVHDTKKQLLKDREVGVKVTMCGRWSSWGFIPKGDTGILRAPHFVLPRLWVGGSFLFMGQTLALTSREMAEVSLGN